MKTNASRYWTNRQMDKSTSVSQSVSQMCLVIVQSALVSFVKRAYVSIMLLLTSLSVPHPSLHSLLSFPLYPSIPSLSLPLLLPFPMPPTPPSLPSPFPSSLIPFLPTSVSNPPLPLLPPSLPSFSSPSPPSPQPPSCLRRSPDACLMVFKYLRSFGSYLKLQS